MAVRHLIDRIRDIKRPLTIRTWAGSMSAVLVMVLTGAVVCAGAASASSVSRGAGQMKAGDVWYGNYKTGSDRGYCGDPIAGGANLYAPTANGGTSYGSVITTTGWNPKTTGVGALSTTNVHRLAYVLARHGKTDSNSQAAHVSYAVRMFVGSPGGAKGSTAPYAGSIKKGGAKFVDEAKKYAGPYALEPKLDVADDKQTAILTDYRPRSASGATMTGYAGSLTIDGPAVFEDNGKTTMSAPPDGATVAIRATSTGEVTVNASYETLPSTKLHYRNPANRQYQRILLGGHTEPVSGTVTVVLEALGRPRIATKTSDQVASSGAELTDTLEVTDMAPHTSIEVTSTLYGPFDTAPVEAAAPPDGAHVAGTVTTTATSDADGTAIVVTEPVIVNDHGYYVWFETSDATSRNAAWPGRFGRPSETTLVPWQPSVTTQTSEQTVEPGAQITDTLTVTGLRPGATTTITTSLYGPFTDKPAVADKPPVDAPKVETLTLDVTADPDGNVVVTTDPLTVDALGYYVWHETIDATSDHAAWIAPFGIAAETTHVTTPPPPPTSDTPTPGRPVLPDAGSEASPAVAMSVAGLLVGGCLLVVIGRRRSRYDRIVARMRRDIAAWTVQPQ